MLNALKFFIQSFINDESFHTVVTRNQLATIKQSLELYSLCITY